MKMTLFATTQQANNLRQTIAFYVGTKMGETIDLWQKGFSLT